MVGTKWSICKTWLTQGSEWPHASYLSLTSIMLLRQYLRRCINMSLPNTSFESGQMVLKELKGTFFDAYLWQTMWNNAKKSMEELKLPDPVFLQGDGRRSVLKTLKTTKSRKTKTPVSQIFQVLWPTQGGTMLKGMARAFRKCETYGGGVVLIHSYRPSKLVQISIIFSVDRRCPQKITLVQFWDFWSETNRSSAQWGCLQLLFVSERNFQNWMSVIFGHLLSTEKFIEICTDFDGL